MRGRPFAVLLAVVAIVAPNGVAFAQPASQARADGKQFGAAIAGRARAAAVRPPDADTVPNFSRDVPASALFDDAGAIRGAAARAAPANPGYATVRSSVERRPRIARGDVTGTVARGRAIAADPTRYVAGMAVGGSTGRCRALPAAGGAGVRYEATCNRGVALEQRAEQCVVPLVVTVVRTPIYRYWCSAFDARLNRVDECGRFDGASCTVTGSHPGRCLQGFGRPPAFTCTEPGEPVDELDCPSEVAGATLRGTSVRTSTSERRDETACAPMAADAGCVVAGESCTSSDPVTRVVDGVSVTKPCWAWGRTYRCSRQTAAQDCDALDHDARCRFDREQCLTDEAPCPTTERIYACTAPADAPAASQYVCDGDVYCVSGECETIDRQPNAEFKDAVVALNAAADAGRQFDPTTLSLFRGERQTCHSKVFGLLNCCRGKGSPLVPGSQLLVSLGCAREEVQLHQRDAQGLCAYVGSYCSDTVLGVCVTKKKAYCCFESKLSRILQEQGRLQLGKSWAKPKRETCRGFTVDEFARLDLSRMDFSEVYAEFQDAAKLPAELTTVDELKRRISGYYARDGAGR